MMKHPRIGALVIAVTVLVLPSRVVHSQNTIPIRELAPPDAKSPDHFGLILGLRPLPNGKLLVDDGGKHQLVVLDQRLANRTVVVDSASTTGPSYGARPAPIVPYLADSTLLADVASGSLLVLAPDGHQVRVAAAPVARDVYYLTNSASGMDANGRLLYRGQEPMTGRKPDAKGVTEPPDSAPIVRANFETRAVDTVARVKLLANRRTDAVKQGDHIVFTTYVSPLTSLDEWAVLSDGTIAVVRGQDYHVELFRADGSTTSGPKLPFDWKRLSDADRQALIDSTHKAQLVNDSIVKAMRGNGSPSAMAKAGISVSAASLMAEQSGAPIPVSTNVFITTEVPASELADYWPPIRTGAVRADYDNQLWILPSTSAQSTRGELVYDVVSNRGVLLYRVRLPQGKTIAGFGKNGVVYLTSKDADGWTLERTSVKR